MIAELVDAPEQSLGEVALPLAPTNDARTTETTHVAAAASLGWNTVRDWTARENTASGIAALLILADRVPSPAEVHPLWGEIARRGSEHQDGLLGIVGLLRKRLDSGPSVAELAEWIVRRFLIGPHEVIAYSKLPKATFRFSWDETGRLRFFNPGGRGLERFSPSDDRRQAMATLSEDLGFWRRDDDGWAELTTDGLAFVEDVFG